MKRNLLMLVCLIFSAATFAQTNSYYLTGRIIDGATQLPLQAASVFAQNTTIGTVTDANGNFTLKLPIGGYDLAITFTGYETISRRITTADSYDKNIVIEMKQKEKAMEDVVIRASNEVLDGWEKYGSFFLDNFIGKSNNSKLCTITNSSVLKFYYYKRKDRLKVLATEPLEIENLALGYKIKYTLDSFIHDYKTQAGIYTGYPLFEEITTTDSLQQINWRDNREKAYSGSLLHFMRSVYDKTLKDQGFEIQFIAKKEEKESAIKLTDFYNSIGYKMDDSSTVVEITPYQPDIAILYTNDVPDPEYLEQNSEKARNFQLSVINVNPGNSIDIEQNGYYYDQSDITITGYLAWHKIADMLPYNYNP
ncbi:MAG: carboxypeptidase-like regulatory domain-containing protein [Ferruginibacter sp.]